jgi:hypothetical protein
VLVLDSRRISGLSDGNAVSQWDDASRSGWNVTQSTGALQPIYKTAIQGGNPVVRFDGANTTNTGDRLISSSVSVSQTYSFVIAFQVSSSDANAATIFDSYNSVQSIVYRGTTNDSANKFVMNSGGGVRYEFADSNTNWNVAAGEFNNGTRYGSLNGTKTTSTNNIGTNGLSGFSVGNIRGNPTPIAAFYSLNGDIGLIAVISTALADPLRKRLEHAAAYSFKISCN